MDRTIVYPAALPQDTDTLSPQRNIMVAFGALMAAVIGNSTAVYGLGCGPSTPASMSVIVGPGSIFSLEPVDNNAFGSLPADTADNIVKCGINLASESFALSPPATAGTSINYLIEGQFLEADSGAAVLPYYNPANPAAPFSGPNNTGISQNTTRTQRVQLQLKAGTAANAGTQTTPAVDAGWVGLWVITVNNGQTTITPSSITQYPGAPFLTAQMGTAFAQKPFYNATQSLSTTTSNNSTYTIVEQVVTMPVAGPTGGFRLRMNGILNGGATAAMQQNFTLSVTDGTTSQSGAAWIIYTDAAVAAACESTFLFPTVYAPGQQVTITLKVATEGGGGHSGQMAMTSANLQIEVVDA